VQSDELHIPPLSETRHSRETLIEALRDRALLPSTEVAVATLYAADIESDILALLARACAEDLARPANRLLFRGLHILGGRRLSGGFPLLIEFLHGPERRIEDLFGDAVTSTLARILAGMFDGDTERLFGLMTDSRADPFVRNAAFGTLGFLVFDGRIDKGLAEDFLDRFDAERTAPADDFAWYSWMMVIGLLGLEGFSQRVRTAFEDGRIPRYVMSEENFHALLATALDRPNDATRFEDEELGYIEDVLAALEYFYPEDDDGGDGLAGTWPELDDDIPANSSRRLPDERLAAWPSPEDRVPVRNPFRHVGRNDPCPCGSGKKFKRCCMP
jgi:hypothetical protein